MADITQDRCYGKLFFKASSLKLVNQLKQKMIYQVIFIKIIFYAIRTFIYYGSEER